MTSSPSLPHGCSDQQGKEPASSPSYGTVRQAGEVSETFAPGHLPTRPRRSRRTAPWRLIIRRLQAVLSVSRRGFSSHSTRGQTGHSSGLLARRFMRWCAVRAPAQTGSLPDIAGVGVFGRRPPFSGVLSNASSNSRTAAAIIPWPDRQPDRARRPALWAPALGCRAIGRHPGDGQPGRDRRRLPAGRGRPREWRRPRRLLGSRRESRRETDPGLCGPTWRQRDRLNEPAAGAPNGPPHQPGANG